MNVVDFCTTNVREVCQEQNTSDIREQFCLELILLTCSTGKKPQKFIKYK